MLRREGAAAYNFLDTIEKDLRAHVSSISHVADALGAEVHLAIARLLYHFSCQIIVRSESNKREVI